MPSGSKKRKAAKKKKEKEAAHHHHQDHHQQHAVEVHSHGDGDLKHHDDDKESDAEEVGSPASQEHPNIHHRLTDGEKEGLEKTEDSSNVQASSEGNQSFGGVNEDNKAREMAVVERQGGGIEQEVKSADVELNSKNLNGENFEPQKEANGGVLLQTKESAAQIETDSKPTTDEVSSKNEIVENVQPVKEDNDAFWSQDLDEDGVQIEIESKPDIDEPYRKTEMVENVKPKNEGSDEVLSQNTEERSVAQMETDSKPAYELNSENAIMENVKPQMEGNDGAMLQSLDQGSVAQIEADLKAMDEQERKNATFEHAEPLKESTYGDVLQSKNEESHVIDKTIAAVDNDQVANSIEAVTSLSGSLTEVNNGIEAGNDHFFVETSSKDKVEKVNLLDEKINGNRSALAHSNGEVKEKVVKEAILQEVNGRMSPVHVDLGPNLRGEEAVAKTGNNMATSDAKFSTSREIGEKLSFAYNVPAIETTNTADFSHSTNNTEHPKDAEFPKSSDCQPLLASGPRAMQRTSWLSCCGLFEVFAKSER